MHETPHAFLATEVPLLVNLLLPHITPCIVGESLRCSEDDIPIGASKFCGRPDVPPEFEWPMTDDGPCWFLGQLNLEECDHFNVGVPIPAKGILSFFYHDMGGPPGSQSRMLHFNSDDLRRVDVVPDTRWWDGFHSRHHYSRSLSLSQGFCLPELEDLALSQEQIAVYSDLDRLIWDFNHKFAYGLHQFLGLPGYVYEPVPEKHQLIASFGDCHDRILYFIPNSDVASLRPSKLHVAYECT